MNIKFTTLFTAFALALGFNVFAADEDVALPQPIQEPDQQDDEQVEGEVEPAKNFDPTAFEFRN